MAVRKMGLELVFNLQWKNKPENGGEKANVMGMYDTPSTTQNFEIFKSYLLKNSGVAGNDVKVTYITDTDGEWVIENQTGFEIALTAFRLKARLGEVIFLKLDKIQSDAKPKMLKKLSTDVETQYDEAQNIPPQWFLEYMDKFKKDLVEEVAAIKTPITVPNTLPNAPSINNTNNSEVCSTAAGTGGGAAVAPVVIKKHRLDGGAKRSRKHLPHGGDLEITERNYLKNLKMERKLDSKLEKFDAKIKKAMEKKRSIQMKITKSDEEVPQDAGNLMNADSVNEGTMKPHMLGGERYLHTWEVINIGKLRWTSNVELRLTWGSVDMVPAVKAIPVPKLKPGEIGYISVLFQIPKTPGQYESYWNFYDKDSRFGHTLSFCVIVDAPINSYDDLFNAEIKMTMHPNNIQNTELYRQLMDDFVKEETAAATEATVANGEDTKPDQIEDDCSDSDVQSLASGIDDENEQKKNDEFVVVHVPSPVGGGGGGYRLTEEDEQELAVNLSKNLSVKTEVEENKQGQEEGIKENLNDNEQAKTGNDEINNNNNGSSTSSESIDKLEDGTPSEVSYNMVCLSGSENEDEEKDYIYIEVKGKKVLLPKNILHPDYVAATAATVKAEDKTEEALQKEPSSVEEAAAAPLPTSSENQGRLFIFPQNNPGFEVLLPTPKMAASEKPPVLTKETTKTERSAPYPAECGPDYGYTTAGQFCDYRKCWIPPAHRMQSQFQPQATPQRAYNYPSQTSFSPVPNFQQSAPKHTPTRTFWAGPSNCAYQPIFSQSGSTFSHKMTTPSAPTSAAPAATATAAAAPEELKTATAEAAAAAPAPESPQPVHILPENLVNGAVNVARSVINMFTPPKQEAAAGGYWDTNGRWVTVNADSKRAKNLQILNDMGFWDQDLNATLLGRYNDDLARVVSELVS